VEDSTNKEALISKILGKSSDQDLLISGTALKVLITAIEEIEDLLAR